MRYAHMHGSLRPISILTFCRQPNYCTIFEPMSEARQPKQPIKRIYYVQALLCNTNSRTPQVRQCTVMAQSKDRAAQIVRGYWSGSAKWVSAHVVGLATDQQLNSSRFTHLPIAK